MSKSAYYKNIFVYIICLLYILLFVYAAVSKLIDFEHFKNQIGQSPLLTAYASTIAWIVPICEILVSILLVFKGARLWALFCCYILMVMFSTYILIILTISSFIPCSCGGILEKLGWNEHLIFNIVFVLLAIIAIVFENSLSKNFITNKKVVWITIISGILSIAFVFLLYFISENEVHRNNGFVRRYPHHPITDAKGIKLPYNSYYLSGYTNGVIYLGNRTAPLHMMSIDTMLNKFDEINIDLSEPEKYGFRALRVKVSDTQFYVSDGVVPGLFYGSVYNWKTSTGIRNIPAFSQSEIVSSNSFCYRTTKDGRYQLGVYDFIKKTGHLNPNLIEKQIDGLFDSDGTLLFNEELNEIIYVYHYRNEFIVADDKLNQIYNGHTIDTVSQAKLQFAYEDHSKVRKLAHPPERIQEHSCTSGRYLFIRSERLGYYEPEIMLKQASIIDVYDLISKTYEFSFYLYDFKDEKIKSFAVYDNLLIGLTQNYLVISRLKKEKFNMKYLE